MHRQLGHLGEDHELDSADGRLGFAAGDRIQFLKTDKTLGLYNASVGTIRHIENGRVFADIDGRLISFDTAQYQSFRHGYAGTIYKGQGATVDQSYLYHSEHWRSAASYVGMTRHREKAKLFAATNSAANLDELARQMSRVDEGKRYAASHFHHRQEVGPVRPMTAREILEHFSGDSFRDRPDQNRRRPHVIAQRAAEMRGARTARPLRHQQNQRPIRTDRQNEGSGKMDDYEDEEEQRKRRAGVGIDLNEADFKAAADKLRQTETVWRAWQQPAFSAETIAADPWTAVYLPMPEPETVLLDVYVKAHQATVACTDMAVHHQRGPRVPQGNDGLAENLAKAQARLIEIEDIVKLEMQRRTELHERAASNQNDPERVSVVGTPEPELGSAERDAAVVASLKAIFATREGETEPQPAEEQNRQHQPFGEREGRSFQPSQRQPGRYDTLRTEVTADAIQRDPWNAVALDLPAAADARLLFLVAKTARDLQFSLSDSAGEAFAVPDLDPAEIKQAEMWDSLADQARQRQKDAETLIRGLSSDTPMSKEAIDYDPWAAVYQPIPADADAALLQKAYGAVIQCVGAVAGEPGPTRHAYEPDFLGADQSREQNFDRAVQRINELDGRLRAAELQQKPAPETEFSHETIKDDPWTAVYLEIPANADQALLKEAHATVVRCSQAVSRPPNPFDIYAPDDDHTREQNFENAVRRLDELGSRLRAAQEPAEPLIADETTQSPNVQQQEPAPDPGHSDKAKLAEELLVQQDDMHSHYDIAAWQGGFAVFRIYEIEDQMLEPSLPAGQQVLGRAETLDQLHEAIIDGSALTAYPQWVTDQQMDEARNSQPLTLDDIAERVQRIIDDPTRQAGEHEETVLQALQARRTAETTETPAVGDKSESVRLAEQLDDDRRRQHGDPDGRQDVREDRHSSESISERREAREEVTKPRYDRDTGERLDEGDHAHDRGSRSLGQTRSR